MSQAAIMSGSRRVWLLWFMGEVVYAHAELQRVNEMAQERRESQQREGWTWNRVSDSQEPEQVWIGRTPAGNLYALCIQGPYQHVGEIREIFRLHAPDWVSVVRELKNFLNL
jgi:hypothetical protein